MSIKPFDAVKVVQGAPLFAREIRRHRNTIKSAIPATFFSFSTLHAPRHVTSRSARNCIPAAYPLWRLRYTTSIPFIGVKRRFGTVLNIHFCSSAAQALLSAIFSLAWVSSTCSSNPSRMSIALTPALRS